MSSSEKSLQLWDGELMISPFGTPLNPEQAAATIDRDSPLILEASAGAGKTLVLVERFVRDVLEGGSDGVPLECEQILAITFTRKAAAELRGRIRRRFAQLAPGNARARDAVSQLDSAWISTIDSFCARLLRRHALLVGIDPSFELIDEIELRIHRRHAFRAAADRLSTGEDSAQALDLLAADGFDNVMKEIDGVYEKLRSAGQAQPRLPVLDDSQDPQQWTRLLDRLLVAYGEEYSALKRADGGCDFADVVFATRDLLTNHPTIAASYRERFKRVLIDEFQDTNRLQLELFDALGVPSRFQVGDPLQSIYGFRNADLDVFMELAADYEQRGQKRRLTTNYRSRPEILRAINAGLSEIHVPSGIEWAPIEGGNEEHAQGPLPLVELLFTDKGLWEDAELSADGAEARLVASRIKQLIDSGEATSGEIVILMEARTKMGNFRSELERLGIEAVADGGEDWWNRIELVDLMAQLRLLTNRADEEALLGALRSPLCGISLDALALLGAQKLDDRGLSLWQAFEIASGDQIEGGSKLAALDDGDRLRLRNFRSMLSAWELEADRLGVGAMLERVVADSGYVSLLLAGEDGRQQVANVRQLLAIAHSFERRHGSDLRRFVAWVAEASEGRSDETDAPLGGDVDDDESDPDGPVRLMTIHSAKGLEYPVVVVPTLGTGVRSDSPMIRVDGGQVGCALYCAGDEGEKQELGAMAELKQQADLAAHFERRRKIHVAVTRAERRLILSGAEKAGADWSIDDTRGRSCLIWMVPGLLGANATELIEAGGDQIVPIASEHGEGEIKLVVSSPDRAAELFADPVAKEAGDGAGTAQAIPVALSALAAPAVATISYSLLARVAECPYRWYLENLVGLPPREDDGYSDGSVGARARGTLTHQLLEKLTFSADEQAPSEEQILDVASSIEGAKTDRDSIKDQRTMLEAFIGSPVWEELSESTDVECESSFALEIVPGDPTLPVLVGTIDALAAGADGRMLVVDYKTDKVGDDDDLDHKVEARYGLQRDAYALAALRRGAEEVEVIHCFLQRPGERVSATFNSSQEGELVGRLRAAAETVTKSDFPVSDHPHRGLCTGCPARPVGNMPGLCSHSDAETSRTL